MNSNVIALIVMVAFFGGIIGLFIQVLILALYYSFLKRTKMYFQLGTELGKVLNENRITLQQLRKEEEMVQKMRAQKQLSGDDDDHLMLIT